MNRKWIRTIGVAWIGLIFWGLPLQGGEPNALIENPGSYRIAILQDGTPNAVIVTPDSAAGRKWAETLNEALTGGSGAKFPVLAPHEVIDDNTWLVREEYRGKQLIIIGNTANNPALWEFFLYFYAGACPDYPGKDEFVVRTIFEPFVSDKHALLIGGCDSAAISRALDWLCGSLPKWRESENIRVPALIAGLKPQERFIKVGNSYWGYLGRTAHRFWWDGHKESIAKAVKEFRAIPPEKWGDAFGNNHYAAWPQFIGFQWLLSAGGFDREEIARIKSDFPKNWLGSVDRDSFIKGDSTRHGMTDITAKWIVGKWILGHCPLDEDQRAQIRKIVADREKILEEWSKRLYLAGDSHHDPLPSQAQLSTHIALTSAMRGDRQFIKSMAAEMATHQLSGFYRHGPSLYAFPAGIAAQLGRNQEMTWLIRHLNNGKFSPFLCFGPLNAGAWFLGADLEEKFPEQYQGLYIQKPNPPVLSHFNKKGDFGMKKNEVPVERCFDFAVFRGGFEGKDDYLSLMGLNRQVRDQPLLLNSIHEYADFGEVFLKDWKGYSYFTCSNPLRMGCQRSERMQVIVESVDEEAPAPYAELRHQMRFADTAAVTSRDPANNGTQWDRTVFWRRGKYFVVHDRLEAKQPGNYNFTCKWRSPHAASLNGRNWGGEVRGKTFAVIGAQKYDASVRCGSPGQLETYELEQRLARRELRTGASVTFGNLIFSYAQDVRRKFNICQPAPNHLMVKGESAEGPELALMGVELSGEIIPGLLSAEAGLAFISPEVIRFGELTSYELDGKRERFDSPRPLKIELNDKLRAKLAARLEEMWRNSAVLEEIWRNSAVNPFEDLPSFEPEWVISDLLPDKTESDDLKFSAGKTDEQGDFLDIAIDFAEEKPIESISLGMQISRDGPYSYAPGELVFAVSTDTNYQFAADYRREPAMVEAKFYFYRLPGLDYCPVLYRPYNYGGNMPSFRIPIDRNTRCLKIRAYKTGKHNAGVSAKALQKIFFTAKRKPAEYRVRLNSGDLDGDGLDELIAIGGRRHLAVYDSAGKRLWEDKPGIARGIDATARQVLQDITNQPDPPEELARFRDAGEIEVDDWIMLAKPVDLRNWDEVKAKPRAPQALLAAGSGEWLKLYQPDGSAHWFRDYLAAANQHADKSVKISHRDSARIPSGAAVVYPQALDGQPQFWLATWCNHTYVFDRDGNLLKDIEDRELFVNQPVFDHDLTGDGKPDAARFTMFGFAVGEEGQRERLELRNSGLLMGLILNYAFAELPHGERKCVFVSSYEMGLLDFKTFKTAKRIWQKDFNSQIYCADFIWGENPGIIAGRQDGLLLKHSMQTGERLRHINLGEPIIEVATAKNKDGDFVFCVTPSFLYKLDADLKPLARRNEPHFTQIWQHPALFERINYLRKLAAKDGTTLIAVSGKDGKIRAFKP